MATNKSNPKSNLVIVSRDSNGSTRRDIVHSVEDNHYIVSRLTIGGTYVKRQIEKSNVLQIIQNVKH